ncbi:MAG TPA: alpha/beta fold hydrolase [Candidatus Methylomirabilis sp.]|nr:alpha/beta fold hydrolase [Candidatus Methylomirabilis sp.]
MYVSRPGAKIFYQVTGAGERDLALVPACYPIVHSRVFKAQIPYLSRHFRVITMDFRGNGRSDHASTGYDFDTMYGDLEAVLEAVARPPFALVALSCANILATRYAVEHPAALSQLIMISPQYSQPLPEPFEEKFAPLIRADFPGYLRRFWTSVFPEPHSLKGIEDGIAWGSESTPEILIESLRELRKDDVRELLPRIGVPTLVMHGTRDRIVPHKVGQEVAEVVPGARFVSFDGGGHGLQGREAAKVNRLIGDFVSGRDVASVRIPPAAERMAPPPRPRTGRRRILWLSSPIGLGHIQRDVAIAKKLREIYPDAAVDFLAADPSRRVVEHLGERVHPGTDLLVNESAHFESWASDHELHAFNALWDMDEIMAANFMVFADAVEATDYDLWVGDEGWDLDYFLHENPDMKRAPYAFLTDFIGVLPMRDDATSTEYVRAREKNAENIDHLRLHPEVRDLSILVGDEDDVLDRDFAPGLPNMRQWAREHFKFSGYTYHFDPAAYRDREALRRRLGYRDDERVILVSAGGTRVGLRLLQKCGEAFASVAPGLPETRMVLVAGPRLDPRELPAHPRIDVRSFVPDLFEHHAAADLAIVQGGLTTTMELAAVGTPFLYFPLRNHFEQQYHVARRLDRIGAGVRLDYDATSPEMLGAAILEQLGKPARWAAVPADGTERAARMIATLL